MLYWKGFLFFFSFVFLFTLDALKIANNNIPIKTNIGPNILQLGNIPENPFLEALISELESCTTHNLNAYEKLPTSVPNQGYSNYDILQKLAQINKVWLKNADVISTAVKSLLSDINQLLDMLREISNNELNSSQLSYKKKVYSILSELGSFLVNLSVTTDFSKIAPFSAILKQIETIIEDNPNHNVAFNFLSIPFFLLSTQKILNSYKDKIFQPQGSFECPSQFYSNKNSIDSHLSIEESLKKLKSRIEQILSEFFNIMLLDKYFTSLLSMLIMKVPSKLLPGFKDLDEKINGLYYDLPEDQNIVLDFITCHAGFFQDNDYRRLIEKLDDNIATLSKDVECSSPPTELKSSVFNSVKVHFYYLANITIQGLIRTLNFLFCESLILSLVINVTLFFFLDYYLITLQKYYSQPR